MFYYLLQMMKVSLIRSSRKERGTEKGTTKKIDQGTIKTTG
jgi:hypothetical protein